MKCYISKPKTEELSKSPPNPISFTLFFCKHFPFRKFSRWHRLSLILIRLWSVSDPSLAHVGVHDFVVFNHFVIYEWSEEKKYNIYPRIYTYRMGIEEYTIQYETMKLNPHRACWILYRQNGEYFFFLVFSLRSMCCDVVFRCSPFEVFVRNTF